MQTQFIGADMPNSYIVIHMDEHYAFEVSKVVEISGPVDIISAENAARYIAGVGSIRGRLIPIVDMRIRLDKQPCPGDESQCIIVVRFRGRELGLITGSDINIIQLNKASIEPPPPATKSKPGSYLQGLCVSGDDIYLMLDIDRLISMNELSGLVEAAARKLDGINDTNKLCE